MYKMMMMMMMIIIMMIKTRNDHNLVNFEATFSRFGMVIGCNDTYNDDDDDDDDDDNNDDKNSRWALALVI